MLAARDQENLIYSQQTNAANKPLNKAIRGLKSKTPGQQAPKTPFKASLNTGNKATIFETQKTGLKALGKENENHLRPKKQDGTHDSRAFVTPMGPRTRAPLGLKTTNAKAQAFQTPAPLQQSTKREETLKKASTARKSIKTKIRIAPSEPVGADILSQDPDSDVPDIEYCPPHPVELSDPPEDITYDENLPYLRGKNLYAGYGEVYDIPRDEHGISLTERKKEEAHARLLQQMENKLREEMAKPWSMEDDEDKTVDAMIAAGPKKIMHRSSNVDTIRAKGAVSALASQPQPRLPSAATMETASSMQKKKSAFALPGKKTPLQPINPSHMRHNAAVAASKTTMGYSKGRHVSSILPGKQAPAPKSTAKIDQSKIHPLEFRELYGEPPAGSMMWHRFMQHGLFDNDGDDDEVEDDLAGQLCGADVHSEDEEEIFQLPMPEEV
ncbi:hypothetical protein GJ744_004486 [Endocarpon pusillum]|uniref:Uncharacterized protein n=1 Tax=Endocarpon pusillum TaxID=364733 RepID=A0A8H7AWB9_9EURO|nr:hypothetical protein GJ744_004486 [Endocarpon pusillum]